MNNESKCLNCGKDRNLECECHTPAPEDWEEATLTNLLEELHAHAFIGSVNSITDEEESYNPIVKDKEAIIEIRGEWDREDLKRILRNFIASREAAARDEGVRIAYSSSMYVTRDGIVLKNPAEAAYEKGRKDAAKEILDAARSEGING